MALGILTAAGEEYFTKILDGTLATTVESLTVGLYNDSTDLVTDSDEALGTSITTEPTTANFPSYARQPVEVVAAETAADQWGLQSVNPESFTLDGTTAHTVDGIFFVANFTSTEGGSLGDWLIGNAPLTQARDCGSVDSIDFAAGEIELNLE